MGIGDFTNVLTIGVGVMVWKSSPRPVRILTVFLILNFLIDMSAIIMGRLIGYNLILLNLYHFISYPLIAVIFAHWLDGKARTLTLLSAPIYIGLCLYMHFSGMDDLLGPGKYFHTIKGLMVGLIVLGTLFVLMVRPADGPISSKAPFWITIGTFFLCTCGVAVYAAIPEQITHELWYIHTICIIIAYLIYIRGFWCLRKEGYRATQMI